MATLGDDYNVKPVFSKREATSFFFSKRKKLTAAYEYVNKTETRDR